MKKWIIAICVLIVCATLLPGCANEELSTDFDEFKSVEQNGQLPDEFKNIVATNEFYGVTAFENRLLKSEILESNEEDRTVTHQIRMMDLYGTTVATYTCTSGDAYQIDGLTATQDGGFLFVLGFSDYAYDQDTWASDEGFASRIIKCDKDGSLRFDTPLEGVEGRALQYCFERNGKYYFFGTMEPSATKTQGIGSPSDIHMVVLDDAGTVINTRSIAGSDFDNLEAAEMTGDGFLLSISAQSNDGDFTGSTSDGYPEDWIFKVNEDLQITDREMKSGRDYFDTRLGEKDGKVIYKSDALLSEFDAGTPEVFIDYGDFYLIVSSNITGIYENTPPVISSTWHYTESVYSAYDYDGKLLFRASVDSSPDYDAWVQDYYSEP